MAVAAAATTYRHKTGFKTLCVLSPALGGLNRSIQHHLIYVCSLKVVLNEAREMVWTFCDREK